MQDPSHVASLNALQGQRRNQRSPDTRAVLSSQDLNGIFILRVLLRRPVQDLA